MAQAEARAPRGSILVVEDDEASAALLSLLFLPGAFSQDVAAQDTASPEHA